MFDHEKLKVFFRDEIKDFNDANISIANSGLLYGLGVFTGMRAHYNEKEKKVFIFRPDAHFKRFSFSCKLLRYDTFLKKYDYAKFLKIIKDLIQVNNIREDVYIRISNFSDENKITPKLVGYKDVLSAFLYPLENYVPSEGMKCITSSWVRVAENALPARAKIHGAYVNSAFAKAEALINGYDEALFLDSKGHIIEGSAENIFIVRENKLVTPPLSDNILEGITRNTVMQIASDNNIEVVERNIGRSELYAADEVFLTGTGAKVSPVVEIDKYKIGNGQVGLISAKIQGIYHQVVRGEIPQYRAWVVDAYQD